MQSSSLADVKGSRAPEGVTLNDPKLGQFKIIKMTMRDASETSSKGVFWSNSDWDMTTQDEQSVKFPKAMLDCAAIGREMTFFAEKAISDFSVEQNMYLGNTLIETLSYDFGFVIPKSTNSWEQIIEADVGQVLPAEVLSGNLVVQTSFKAKGVEFARTNYRVYYE